MDDEKRRIVKVRGGTVWHAVDDSLEQLYTYCGIWISRGDTQDVGKVTCKTCLHSRRIDEC